MIDEAQLAYLMERLKHVLGEHTDSFLIMVQVSVSETDSRTLMSWAGGFNNALGMAERAKLRLATIATAADSEPPDDTEEDWMRA